jgi:SAM-dependent methyltransferase
MTTAARFRVAYAEHRSLEGRGAGGPAELLTLPFLSQGAFARDWTVRARTYEAFVDRILRPRAQATVPRGLSLVDLGAGNGWLCYRMSQLGHHAIAVDWRRDLADGLGAAEAYREALPGLFPRVGGSFQEIPLRDHAFDIVVFNAALHYSEDLAQALREAARVARPGGRVVVLDSPFYAREADGDRMVVEKRSAMARALAARSDALLALRSIEFLTRRRLEEASAAIPLTWVRHRVRYPLWYEVRPLSALLRGRRRPSRFDLWEAVVP